MKVYIDNTCPATKARYIIPEFISGFYLLENFFNTKRPDGSGWFVIPDRHSFMVWHKEYKEPEMLEDLALLGFEMVSVDQTFDQFKHFTNFLDKQGVSWGKI
jgi:hypothetical protein